MTPRRAAGLAALAALFVCLPALRGGFVIDDAYLIVGNQGIRSLGNLPDFFLRPWGGGEGASGFVGVNAAYYRPLTTSLFALEHAVFGPNPVGWHLASISLHATATAFVVLLAWRLLGSVAAALFGGLLFAVHPVHTEAIAALCYQTTLLAGLLAMMALWALVRHGAGGTRPWRRSLLPALFTVLAGLAKEEAAALPLLALAWLALAPASEQRRANIVPVAGMFLAAALVLLCRQAVVTGSSDTYFGGAGAAVVLLTMLRVSLLYAGLLLVPLVLCPFYDWFIITPSSSLSVEAVAGGGLMVALVFGTVALRKRAPGAAIGLAWLVLALAPVMHIVPILNVAAERFLYLPSLGFAIAVAALFDWLRSRRPRLVLGVSAALLGLFAARTLARWPDWRDDRALNQATAADFPESPTPLLNLARIEEAAGNRAAALRHLEEAAKRAPGWPVPVQQAKRLRAATSR
ncbi:MAG: hypothetical protein JXP73_16300 [Deltaproteobacteria bacterium]|nr:hypothetical protein [Deltaproteobacteria bacterium]